jgi:ammonia channel protein AmtB
MILAGIELVLGILMIYIGWQLYNAGEYFRIAIYEMEQSPFTPKHIINLFRTMLTTTLAGGFFALVHGIKRIADSSLNAWVKSAIPETSTE